MITRLKASYYKRDINFDKLDKISKNWTIFAKIGQRWTKMDKSLIRWTKYRHKREDGKKIDLIGQKIDIVRYTKLT